MRFTLPSRHGQQAGEVRPQVWAKRVELCDGKRGRVAATCLVARAAELIEGYRARWERERFFNRLKNGCRIEALQLSTRERLERALALLVVVAWRIAPLRRLGRTCPAMEAELLFDRDEWQAAFILNKKRGPTRPPRLNEGVRRVARLGGFLARQGDGEPGAKTLWQGLQRVVDFAAGLRYARGSYSHLLSLTSL